MKTSTCARHLLILAVTAALAACSLEPAYHRPASGIGSAWPAGAAYSAAHPKSTGQVPAADIGWQEFFTDPQLRELIDIALKNNRNLRIAALNVEKSQAQYRIQRGGLFPSINANASETAQHVPGGIVSSSGAGSGSGGGGTFRTFAAGLGFTSYEIDFFGRIRSLDHEALQQYLSRIEARKSAQISLVAEVANDYLSYLSDRGLLKLAQETYKNQQAAYALTKKSFAGGVDTALDVSQAQQAVDTAQADISKFTRLVAQDRNALQLVLGAPLPADLTGTAGLSGEHFLEALPAGLPSDLLDRRPDILAAEHQLMAANANIGAARAAFFPSISLTGSFGTASSQLSGLFASGSEQWTFAPAITLPIFAGGANVANLDLAKVEKNIFVAQYQQTIQTAFREVADALAARGTLDQQITAEQHLTQATKTSYDLSR
ncbi:MAG TPA: efflux transporter outer membrane subunit, partial [Gammaproteobacteria bacterium]|nr:efflux transporter outer membrane subunit [Gammaproteobacteria bacterium]